MPLSRLREDYLVNYLESEVGAEVVKTKALLTAHLIPLPIKGRNMVKDTFDIFHDYAGILLPTGKKQANIKDIPKEDLAAIREKLSKLNAELKKSRTKPA